MKNPLIVLAFISVFVACDHRVAKTYQCQEFSLSCELKKDRILVMPISFDTTLVDAYGDQLHASNQWYVISTKARALAPIRVRVSLPGGSVEAPLYTFTPDPSQLLNYWRDTKIRIDTADLSAMVYGLNKAVIVVSGVNEVAVYHGYDGQLAVLLEPK